MIRTVCGFGIMFGGGMTAIGGILAAFWVVADRVLDTLLGGGVSTTPAVPLGAWVATALIVGWLAICAGYLLVVIDGRCSTTPLVQRREVRR